MERREKALLALADLLREKPYSARGIAEKIGCTKPTAYASVAALVLRGHKVVMAYAREGLHGPAAKVYSIAG